MGTLDTTLHPLHSPKWVADFVMQERRLPGYRGTGRTTIGLLAVLVDALRNPHKVQSYVDHHSLESGKTVENERLIRDIAYRFEGMVRQLRLKHISYHILSAHTEHSVTTAPSLMVCFGKPVGWEHSNWRIIDGM